MTSVLEQWPAFFAWLVRSSAQAGVLICLILAVQWALRDRLKPQWRWALWLLVVARLVLPWAPPSGWSVSNLLPSGLREPNLLAGPGWGPGPSTGVLSLSESAPGTAGLAGAAIENQLAPGPATEGDLLRRSFVAAHWILLVWGLGAVSLLGCALLQSLALAAAVRRERPMTDAIILDLLEDCKAEMGLSTYLAVVETPRVKCPALFGVVRPRLLLPKGTARRIGLARLKHVFLHELAHLKRHDIGMNWLLTFLQAAHWFNPLIWCGFHRMRADRELACDALALTRLKPEESVDYGGTIIHLAESLSDQWRLPALAGILEHTSQIKRRISMIARSQSNPRRWSVLAAALTLGLAAVALTDAPKQQPKGEWTRPFVDDPAAIGTWQSVDFVRTIENFQPGQKVWQGDLYLKGLSFLPDGATSGPWRWSQGYLWNPGGQVEGHYQIKPMDGATYLFMEWMSGDVTIRGEKPRFYILKKTSDVPDPKLQTFAPQSQWSRPFVNDPAAIGNWESVDLVQKAEDFQPGKKSWEGDLFLKGLSFLPNGATSGPWRWTQGYLWHPGDQAEGKYQIKEMDGTSYLFMEWISGDVTIRHEKPWLYVLKKTAGAPIPSSQVLAPKRDWNRPFVNDPAVIGNWESVDFVQNVEEFQPGKKSWKGDLFFKGLSILPGGATSGPWEWTQGYLWHPGDQTEAHYQIKQMDGAPYLFMEWMSGDVTIRHEKPWFYVLRNTLATP